MTAPELVRLGASRTGHPVSARRHAESGAIVVRSIKAWNFISVLALASASGAFAQGEPSREPAHVTIQAFADQQAVQPGHTFRVALVEHIQPGWHTYWINPGDAGQPTKLRWTLPPGYRVDDVQWPVPQVFRAGSVVTYGYEGRAVLLQSVHAPVSLPAGPAKLSVDVQWLACSNICIPEHGAAEIILNQTPSSSAPSTTTALFTESTGRLPRPAPWPASLRVDPTNIEVRVRAAAHDLPADAKIEFVPLAWGAINSAAAQRVTRAGPDLVLTLVRGDLRAQPLSQLNGLLIVSDAHGSSRPQGFFLQARASDSGSAHT
jgi:DsbC/DsbD-like thiol-disulfide interchange protein